MKVKPHNICAYCINCDCLINIIEPHDLLDDKSHFPGISSCDDFKHYLNSVKIDGITKKTP